MSRENILIFRELWGAMGARGARGVKGVMEE